MPTDPPLVPPAPGRRSRLWLVLGITALLGVGLFIAWKGRSEGAKGSAAAGGARSGGPGGKGGGGERKVPVLVERVSRHDVPIVLEGLGTVTPLATVQLRSQVDGRLVAVNFKEGAVVKRGELLAQVDPRPFQIAVAQTAATVARDEAQLRNAKLMLERDRALRAQNLVPQQTVDDQQTVVDQLEATVRIDQAATDNAKLQLEYSHIVAPVDGITGLRQVDPGNLVRAADATGLVVLTQLDPITVVFTLPQDDLERLQRAMSGGELPVEAWSRDGRVALALGTLAVIDNQVNASTGTVRLKATFPNPRRVLWPNLFVKARLTVDQKKNALVVAASAIQRGPQGTFVYLVSPESTAQLKPVEVDTIEGTLAVLRSGVSEGDTVITDGQNQLKPGAPVDARATGTVAEAGSAP